MIKIKWILLSILALFIVLVISLFTYFEIKYSKSFYPGISIAREKVDGKSYEEILTKFKNKIDLLYKTGLTFNIEGKNGTKQVQLATSSHGLTTDKVVEHFSINDWEATLKNAYSMGHKGSVWQKAKEQISIFFQKKDFIFSPIIQKETIDSFFNDELEDYLAETSSAKFTIKDGKIAILPEIIGERIDSDKIYESIYQKLILIDPSPINLKTDQNIPYSTSKKLEQFLSPVEKIKSNVKVIFHYNGYTWHINGESIITWLTIKQNGKIGINENKLEEYLNRMVVPYIDSPMKNSHFEMQSGKLIEISLGEKGNAVNIVKTTQNVEDAILNIIYNPNETIENNIVDIEIETIVEEPRITKETINKYKIKELVGSAVTNFKGGSSDRQKNIEVGVSKLNGILVAPGQEFSAVDAIGGVTEEAGFVKEYVINNGKTQKEIGGGLCQLATTLFRLALDSGLPIIERVNHRYVISYYGAGLDATIYEPHPDLRFINDTGNYLLLQGKAVNNEVTFEFYGKKDGRTVKISEPILYDKTLPPEPKYIPTETLQLGQTKCTEISHNGVTADTTYTVSYLNGEMKETKFHSIYQPWQKVCLIGIGN